MEIEDARWYTTTEVGRFIGFKRDAVIRLIQTGYIRASRGKHQYRISGKEVRRYMAAAERRAAG